MGVDSSTVYYNTDCTTFIPTVQFRRAVYSYSYILVMGSATGLKLGGRGAKTIIELESEPKFNINLLIYKII